MDFTTQSISGPSISGNASSPLEAIKRAGAATGVSFDYLVKTAQRESSLNADAQASSSSAAGLFQFIEQTWLGTLKQYGEEFGFGEAAAAITRNEAGRYEVNDAETRVKILDLRFDASAASLMAGALARENGSFLENALGRTIEAVDLYAAHFLGAGGAAKLLSSAASANAAELFPSAAKANPTVFFENDRAKTVREVIASFTASIGAQQEKDTSAIENVRAVQPLNVKPVSKLESFYTEEVRKEARTTITASEPRVSEFRSELRRELGPELQLGKNALAFQILQLLDPLSAFNRDKQ